MSTMNMSEQFNKLSLGEKIIIIAGPLFLIFSFFPWFDYDGGPSRSGWSGDFSLFSILAVLVAVIMTAQVAVSKFSSVALPALPQGLSWGRVHLGGGVYIALAVLLRLVIGESVSFLDVSIDADRAFGLWLAVIAAAALAAGGFLMFQEEQKGGSGSGGGGMGSM